MRNLQRLTFLLLTLFSSLAFCDESAFITYDWLIDCAAKTRYTDHIPHFRRLFNTIKVRGFFECGCGFSTKYFLDHCDKVTSTEFLHRGIYDEWYQKCLELYKDCPHWVPILYNGDYRREPFNLACLYANHTQKDYALVDPSYLVHLNQFFREMIDAAHLEGKDIDVAFVDPGVYIRGDMVKLFLANEVPIVVAHDTACDLESNVDRGTYSWFVVKTPPNYEKIVIPWGNGTTFWISKSLTHVVESMKSYRDRIIELGGDTKLKITDLKEIADHL